MERRGHAKRYGHLRRTSRHGALTVHSVGAGGLDVLFSDSTVHRHDGRGTRTGTPKRFLVYLCSRMELLMGKWLAVATINAGVLLQIAGLLFAIGYLASSNFISTPSISLTALVFLCIAVLLFAVMVVAFELALAMRSHSVRSRLNPWTRRADQPLPCPVHPSHQPRRHRRTFWFAIPVVQRVWPCVNCS